MGRAKADSPAGITTSEKLWDWLAPAHGLAAADDKARKAATATCLFAVYAVAVSTSLKAPSDSRGVSLGAVDDGVHAAVSVRIGNHALRACYGSCTA